MAEPVGAIVLAAGGGSRFVGSSHKLLAPLAGRSVIHHVLDAVMASGVSPVIVVTGAVDLSNEIHAAATHGAPHGNSLHVVHNERWRNGMASSLQRGLAAARTLGVAAVVVGLGDQPGVPASAWRRVADTASPLAVATYGGARRNPVRIHAELWHLLPDDGDEGARTLIRIRPELVTEVACEGNADDIDTIDDIARWRDSVKAGEEH
jgi:molybdenum cofactor cytidylyltransferase